MNNLSKIEQRSAAWFQARLGKVTASRIYDVASVVHTGKTSARREAYMLELITERLTGRAIDRYITRAMEHGVYTEDTAALQYEFLTNSTLENAGFFEHPSIKDSGASPDRLVNDDGLLEIKCPETINHVALLLNGSVKPEYQFQMQWQLACTGRDWCDFISFDDRVGESYSSVIIRFERDNDLISKIEDEVIKFLDELDAKIRKIQHENS